MTILIDTEPENVLAGMSLGIHGIVGKADLSRKLKNFIGDPIERGLAFLRQNAGRLYTTTSDGHTMDENYAQRLILEATEDTTLVGPNRPPRLWNFFSGKPKFTGQVYPADMDTTALALLILGYDPALAHLIIDEMPTYVNEDGLTYTDKTRPRVDAVIAVNVLVALHKHGRYYELLQTMTWVQNILFNRACIHGTGYYPSPEWLLFYVFPTPHLFQRPNNSRKT
ncbi:hypothetical protein BDV19DRAFT_390179 [Aspergillus venezuelensis]